MDITCGIFIIRPNNEILFCHPTNSPRKQLSIPKGVIDNDESYYDTVCRELQEETGLILSNISGITTEIEKLYPYKNGKKALKAFIHKTTDAINTSLYCNSFFQNENEKIPEVDWYIWLPYNNFGIYEPHHTQQQVIEEYLI